MLCTNVIERIHRITPEDFQEAFVKPCLPVILTCMMDEWPAMTNWTRENLAAKVGHRKVTVRSAPAGDFSITAEAGPRYDRFDTTFADFLTRLDSPDQSRVHYLQAGCLEESLPELLNGIRIPEPYMNMATFTGSRLWFGPGQKVSLHYDAGHGLLALLKGKKRLTIYDPDQLPYLYHSPLDGPNSSHPYSRVDIDNPDLARFPNFVHARPIEMELNAGEMLFLPAFWWHQVLSEGENVAVNFWWNLLSQRDLAELGQAFAAFHDAYRKLPTEWQTHVGRLTNNLVLNESR